MVSLSGIRDGESCSSVHRATPSDVTVATSPGRGPNVRRLNTWFTCSLRDNSASAVIGTGAAGNAALVVCAQLTAASAANVATPSCARRVTCCASRSRDTYDETSDTLPRFESLRL